MESLHSFKINDFIKIIYYYKPTKITLSNNSINENKQVGSIVGYFKTEDPNPSDKHVYTLV